MNSFVSCLTHERLQQLSADELSPPEIEELEEHLTHCESCRHVLEEAAAEPSWRQEVRDALADEFGPEHWPASADSSTEDGLHDAGGSVEQIRKLLGPTDDPRMLGRIGPYEIVGILGRGGMGVVFKGFDGALNRYVAIKMLLPHLAASGAARKRFAREAQAAAAVVHDHVMAIHSVAEWQGVPYLVMPYGRGVSLQKRLNDKGPLEVREILRIGMQTAAGLAAAHAQGLVHRDVKPANILLDDGVERVTLTDFGLARAVDDASLTRSGVLAGTPQYMSPEQARAKAVDARSDLFSLGSVLYAMCTGRPPFRADSSYAILRMITDEEPCSIREINPDIPEWLCLLISRLMAKSPDARFGNALEVAALLEQCLAHVQQPTSVPLPASLVPHAAGRGSIFNVTRKGVFAMLGTIGMTLLGMVLLQATEPPDISGQWTSNEWGTVVLEAKGAGKYEGTFTGSGKDKPSVLSEAKAGTHDVFAPCDSTVIDVRVENGQTVKQGEILLVLRSDELKTEPPKVRSSIDGVVATLQVKQNLLNRPVRRGDLLLEIQPSNTQASNMPAPGGKPSVEPGVTLPPLGYGWIRAKDSVIENPVRLRPGEVKVLGDGLAIADGNGDGQAEVYRQDRNGPAPVAFPGGVPSGSLPGFGVVPKSRPDALSDSDKTKSGSLDSKSFQSLSNPPGGGLLGAGSVLPGASGAIPGATGAPPVPRADSVPAGPGFSSTSPPDVGFAMPGAGFAMPGSPGPSPGKAKPGTLHLKWSRVERRFNGTWGKGADRRGTMSLRLVDKEIRGGFTTDEEVQLETGTPLVGDLLWKRGGLKDAEYAPTKIAPGEILVTAFAGRGVWNSQDKQVDKLLLSLMSVKGVTIEVREDGEGDAFTNAVVHMPAHVGEKDAESTKQEEWLRTVKITIDEALRTHKVPNVRWLDANGNQQDGPAAKGSGLDKPVNRVPVPVPDGGNVLLGGETIPAPPKIPPGEILVDVYAGRSVWYLPEKEVDKLLNSFKSLPGVTVQIHEEGEGNAFTRAVVHDPVPVRAEPAENQKREERIRTIKIAIDEALRAHKVPNVRWLDANGNQQDGPAAKGSRLDKPTDRQNVRSVVEAFVAAILAGDRETANTLTLAKGTPFELQELAKSTKYLITFLPDLKQLSITSVFVNDGSNPSKAIAFSEEFHWNHRGIPKADRPNAMLRFDLGISNGGWLVTDIDFEAEQIDGRNLKPEESAGRVLKQFLEANPNAVSVVPRVASEDAKVSGVAKPLDRQNARAVVEAFVSAAFSRDEVTFSTLARLRDRSEAGIEQLCDDQRVARLPIQSVYVNDPAKPTRALATSEAVRHEGKKPAKHGQRDSLLMFTLTMSDEGWLVTDIDVESKESADRGLKEFREANPNSISVPSQREAQPREARGNDRLIQRLQGRWQVVRIVDPGGADYVPRKKAGFIVEGHTMTSFGNDLSWELQFRLDESLSPAHFDMLTAAEGNSDQIGLIEVDGDRLKWAHSGNTGDYKVMPIRPAKLEPSLGVHYCEMERVREDARETAKVPGIEQPLDRKNARAVAEAFVAAILSGDGETARNLAKNNPTRFTQEEGTARNLDLKRLAMKLAGNLDRKHLAMKSVYVNDPANPTKALAMSEVVKLKENPPNGQLEGFLVRTLLSMGEEGWIITDINDFESGENADRELKKFLEANPKSISVPPQAASEEVAKPGATEPRQKEARELFEIWKNTANEDGTIPGTFIGQLATEVRAYMKANPNLDSGMKLPKLLPRFVTSRDWSQAEAIKLLDDVAYYATESIAARVGKSKLPSDALYQTKVEFQDIPVAIAKWSEAKDGLRIGMRVVEGEWRVGGEVNVEIWLHNTGTKDLTLKANPQRSDVGVWVVAKDSEGQDHGAANGNILILAIPQTCVLPAGHVAKIKSFTLSLDAPGNKEQAWVQPRFRELQPGSYKLRCEWSDAERQTGYGPDFSTDKFWTGKLTTPELDLTLVAQDAAAKAGADADKPAAKPPGANIVKVPDELYVNSGLPLDELAGEGVKWNDVQNGLSLGYRITGNEWGILSKGAKVELWVRNPGDKDVRFQFLSRPDIGLLMKMKDTKGKEHESNIARSTSQALSDHRLLPPSHAFKVKEFTVSLMRPENDASGVDGHYFAIAPGAYKFHCELELPGFSATGNGGKQITPAAGEWTGKLTTREMDVMVVAPDAPAATEK